LANYQKKKKKKKKKKNIYIYIYIYIYIKILLNYISLDEYSQWESQKNDKRKSYYEFVKELIIDPLWEDIINAKEEIVAVEDHVNIKLLLLLLLL